MTLVTRGGDLDSAEVSGTVIVVHRYTSLYSTGGTRKSVLYIDEEDADDEDAGFCKPNAVLGVGYGVSFPTLGVSHSRTSVSYSLLPPSPHQLLAILFMFIPACDECIFDWAARSCFGVVP